MYFNIRGFIVLLFVAVTLAQPLDPGIPVPNPTIPGWFYGYGDEYNPLYQTLRSTDDLPDEADVTIIGGGWSGVSVAYFLSIYAPQLKVVLLEARGMAEGASGRNLGWMAPKTYDGFIAEVASIGLDAVKKEIAFENGVANDLYALAYLNGWTEYAEIVKNGHVRIYRDEADWNTTLTNLAAYLSVGYNDVFTYTAAQCNALFGITDALGCTKSIKAYKLRPPALIWKILQTALLNPNLNVQTLTAVTSVTSLNGAIPNNFLPYLLQPTLPAQYTIATPRGNIRTNTVVYATNAWTSHLLTFLQAGTTNQYSLFPSSQYVIQSNIHMPLQSTLCIEFAPDQYGLQQREMGGWITAQGWVYGVYNDSANPANQAVFNDSINFLNTVYPKDSLYIAHQWTGIMGYSSDGYPFCGPIAGQGPDKLRSYQWITAGLTGHGNPRAFGLARALVTEMIFGEVELGFPAQYQTNLRPNFGK